jgi:general secretion pathway protein D
VPGANSAPPERPAVAEAVAASGLVDIQADETTNSLVITAPPERPSVRFRSMIAQLDVRRAQVLVEAVIAEISAEKAAELGVQWAIDVPVRMDYRFHEFRCWQLASLANLIGLAAQADSGDLTAISAARVPQGASRLRHGRFHR